MERIYSLETTVQDRDGELAIEAQNGNRIAFDALFQRHKAFVYRVCYRMIGVQDDAVDAAQVAFVDAYRHICQFRHESSFRTWLYRIAINACNNHLRRECRRSDYKFEEAPQRETHGCSDRVWEAMLKLPKDARAVLVLFYFEQLSCAEVAEILKCSEGTVRIRLHRARSAFKELYLGVDL